MVVFELSSRNHWSYNQQGHVHHVVSGFGTFRTNLNEWRYLDKLSQRRHGLMCKWCHWSHHWWCTLEFLLRAIPQIVFLCMAWIPDSIFIMFSLPVTLLAYVFRKVLSEHNKTDLSNHTSPKMLSFHLSHTVHKTGNYSWVLIWTFVEDSDWPPTYRTMNRIFFLGTWILLMYGRSL